MNIQKAIDDLDKAEQGLIKKSENEQHDCVIKNVAYREGLYDAFGKAHLILKKYADNNKVNEETL